MAITEDLIERLVRRFYDRIRGDAELGPIFDSVIQGDWEPHLSKMMDFWSSVTLKTGRYSGRPLPKHIALKQVRPEHFDRWLALFRSTAAEVCEAAEAEIFIERAELIAESFKLGMFGLPDPNQFPARPAPR